MIASQPRQTDQPLLAWYQQQAVAMLNPNISLEDQKEEAYWGVWTEGAEAVDYCKKVTFHKQRAQLPEPILLKKELGDTAWYTAINAHLHGITLSYSWPGVYTTAPEHFRGTVKSFLRTIRDVTHDLDNVADYGATSYVGQLSLSLGSVIRRIEHLAAYYGWTLEDVLQTNLDKLHERYPERILVV